MGLVASKTFFCLCETPEYFDNFVLIKLMMKLEDCLFCDCSPPTSRELLRWNILYDDKAESQSCSILSFSFQINLFCHSPDLLSVIVVTLILSIFLENTTMCVLFSGLHCDSLKVYMFKCSYSMVYFNSKHELIHHSLWSWDLFGGILQAKPYLEIDKSHFVSICSSKMDTRRKWRSWNYLLAFVSMIINIQDIHF